MNETEYKAAKASLKAKLKAGTISDEDYKAEWNAAESGFGVSLTEWPCDIIE